MNKYDHLKLSNWMQTYTGIAFDPATPDPKDVRIEDIAHALSMLCRYTGHTNSFYSVAEHSVIMSEVIAEEFQLEALLHDATEAYLNDIAKPIKGFLPEYKAYEKKLDAVIRYCYSLPEEVSKAIKEADIRMLETERRQVMGDVSDDNYMWTTQRDEVEPYDVELPLYPPGVAKNVFLGRFVELWKEKNWRDNDQLHS